MKYLNSIFDFIVESVESYQWEMTSDKGDKVKYKFEDIKGNLYLVEFKSLPGVRNDLSSQWELTYYVEDDGNFSVSKLVSANPYRVIETVFNEILNDFIKRKSWVKVITIHGLAKDKERQYVSQRTKMYVRFLERNPISGYKLSSYGNRINLTKI
jgi:hypothetical protein